MGASCERPMGASGYHSRNIFIATEYLSLKKKKKNLLIKVVAFKY